MVHVDMQGDPRKMPGRNTRVYAAGEKVKLLELFGAQSVAGVNLGVGAADFQVWGQWEAGVLKQIQGNVNGRGLLLTEQLRFLRIRLVWER